MKAADGGKVVYAGDGVPHLGNLLLVEHAGGYITAYGNNEALLVKKGDDGQEGPDHRPRRRERRRGQPAPALRGPPRRQPRPSIR